MQVNTSALHRYSLVQFAHQGATVEWGGGVVVCCWVPLAENKSVVVVAVFLHRRQIQTPFFFPYSERASFPLGTTTSTQKMCLKYRPVEAHGPVNR